MPTIRSRLCCFKSLPDYYRITESEKFAQNEHGNPAKRDLIFRQKVIRVVPAAYNVRVCFNNWYERKMITCELTLDRPTPPSGRLQRYTLEAVHVSVRGLMLPPDTDNYLLGRQIALLRCWMKFLSKEDRL